MNEMQLEKIKQLIGTPISYSKLCDAINEPKRTGNSKMAHIKELQLYCNIEKIADSSKYIIHQVYDRPRLSPLSPHNKYQLHVEQAVFDYFKSENKISEHLSHTKLLSLLHLVNDNFSVLHNPDNAVLLYKWSKYRFPETIDTDAIQESLYQWADRRLQKMSERGFIKYEDGYCLILEHRISKRRHIEVMDVPIGSDQEIIVQQCYDETYAEIFPYSHGQNNLWIPPKYQSAFRFTLRKKLNEKVINSCIGAYRAKVITLINAESHNIQNVAEVLNSVSVEKVKKMKRFREITGNELEHIIQELVLLNPPTAYKVLLDEARKLEAEERNKEENS